MWCRKAGGFCNTVERVEDHNRLSLLVGQVFTLLHGRRDEVTLLSNLEKVYWCVRRVVGVGIRDWRVFAGSGGVEM